MQVHGAASKDDDAAGWKVVKNVVVRGVILYAEHKLRGVIPVTHKDILSRAMFVCSSMERGPVALDALINIKRKVISDVFCSEIPRT